MNFFKKKKVVEKKLSPELEAKVKNLRRQREKLQREFEVMKEDKLGEHERGDKFREYIRLTEEQFKIKSDISDRRALQTIKIAYRIGLRLKKWR